MTICTVAASSKKRFSALAVGCFSDHTTSGPLAALRSGLRLLLRLRLLGDLGPPRPREPLDREEPREDEPREEPLEDPLDRGRRSRLLFRRTVGI